MTESEWVEFCKGLIRERDQARDAIKMERAGQAFENGTMRSLYSQAILDIMGMIMKFEMDKNIGLSNEQSIALERLRMSIKTKYYDKFKKPAG